MAVAELISEEESLWVTTYQKAKTKYERRPFVYIDQETLYTPIFIDDKWTVNNISGYKSLVYSNKELTNDDILGTVKKFLHLLNDVRIIHTNSDKEYLKELVLLNFPVYQNRKLNEVLLDIFINIYHNSCLGYLKKYSIDDMSEEDKEYFFEHFACCIISNKSKTKLYGRAFYHQVDDVLLNVYPKEIYHALRETYATHRYNRHIYCFFYVDELVYLKKVEDLRYILGLDMFFGYLTKCDSCKEYINEREYIVLAQGEIYCERCAQYCYQCSYCGEYYDSDFTDMYELGNDEYICENCMREKRLEDKL